MPLASGAIEAASESEQRGVANSTRATTSERSRMPPHTPGDGGRISDATEEPSLSWSA